MHALLAILLASWGTGAAAAALPSAAGGHAVGVVRTEFVDATRRLDATDPASGPRRLPAIVWYPAEAPAGTGDAPYMPEAVAAVTVPGLARNFRYPVEDLETLTRLRTQARSEARPARSPGGFPVVVYSHGFFLYPEQNSALALHLASHGYVVVSIAHPGDSADQRLEDGRVAATRSGTNDDDPRFGPAFAALVQGRSLDQTREALARYTEAFPGTRLGRSFTDWRDDTLAVARALVDGTAPAALSEVLATVDRTRLVLAGMSFGGATSATTCRLIEACRAAVNLDGQNFDPGLFDRPVERPLLLVLSDWVRYGLFDGQPKALDFSANDIAYERWAEAGQDRDVLRVRLQGLRHMGFTDLVALLDGPKREERVGEIGGDEALAAMNDLVLAFVDAHTGRSDATAVDRVIDRHRALERHAPLRLRSWVRATDAPP